MKEAQIQIQETQDWFRQKIALMTDPYFDREFFTNLIHCIDRKKSLREIFEAAVEDFNRSPQFSEELDRSFFHFYCSYQAAQYLREFYQTLPLAQGLYTAALFRSEGKSPIQRLDTTQVEARGSSLEEFAKMMERGARRVISFEHAWESFNFLMQSRSTRAGAIQLILASAIEDYDRLTASFLAKAFDICFANAWKDVDVFLRRPFARLWEKGFDAEPNPSMAQARALVDAVEPRFKPGRGLAWNTEAVEELWLRITRQGAESAWEWVNQLAKQGVGIDQVASVLQLFHGRCLFAMRPEQWRLFSEAGIFADSLRTAGRWIPERKTFYIAGMLTELVRVAQLLDRELPVRPTGDSVVKKFSQNMVKNQLILRLDNAVENGDAKQALDLAAILLRDRGLTHSLSDRLVLMAAKQDAWNYSSVSIPLAMFLAESFETSVRLQLPEQIYRDAVYGLLRLYLVQRELSLEAVKRRGHYGDGGLKASNFDVSGGSKIVDRFVFNQLRNAQRIFLWPTEGKG